MFRRQGSTAATDSFGNRYYENLNAKEEVPGELYMTTMLIVDIYGISGRHRWVDLAQHEFNASQVPPEWHSWLSHIRKDPPTKDSAMKAMSPPWKAVSNILRDESS
jgi:NADH dehydrogenase (ubiquinone) 1 alpha subcomplex subunit 12